MIPKFRAWDKNNAYMEYTDKNLTVVFAQDGIQVVDHTTFSSSCTNMEDYVLMQSTGLKDINGVEIYEGDITKVHEFVDFGGVEGEKEIIGVIKYGRVYECPIKEWYLKTKYYYTPLACMNLHEESFEILGNKFEHPHLLEED